MIKIEKISNNIIKATLPTKLEDKDFLSIEKEVDNFIAQNCKIKLLLDASSFNGWENSIAIKNHILFVKKHQHYIDKLALITGHNWQEWISHSIAIFVEPEIKTFEKEQIDKALKWLISS